MCYFNIIKLNKNDITDREVIPTKITDRDVLYEEIINITKTYKDQGYNEEDDYFWGRNPDAPTYKFFRG